MDANIRTAIGSIAPVFLRWRAVAMLYMMSVLRAPVKRRSVTAISALLSGATVLSLLLYCASSVDAQSLDTKTINLRAGLVVNGLANPSSLALLLPDGLTASDPGVVAWIEAAREEGIHIDLLSDTQFLALGSDSNRYRGVIFPDQVHTVASDALVAALEGYVTRGGQAMLVYDFGALDANGTYPIPKSRFSSLVGVDYVLYDELRDRTVGLGPITAYQSQLRTLWVPPGKSIEFVAPVASPPPALAAAMTQQTAPLPNPVSGANDAKLLARQVGVLRHANLAPGEALYLPVNRNNPGGLRGHPHAQQLVSNPFDKHLVIQTPTGQIASKISVVPMSDDPADGPATPRLQFSNAAKLHEVAHTTRLMQPLAQHHASMLAPTSGLLSSLSVIDPLEAVSGYIYGALTYPTYVTRGVFAGSQLLNAPQFGLAAGVNTHGAGKVLFVNLPLTFLKASTDGMLMQSFLHYFSDNMLALPRLATVPNGLGGLTLNWHLCSNFTASMQQLIQQGVFTHGPFSVHITAGPDTVTAGDGLGWDLPHNLQAQQMLRNLDQANHQIGNHGGWIHDYFGNTASETNQAELQPDLDLNKNAVDAVLGHASIEYAAPQGNNPTWSMLWQEQHGDVGTYFLGNTGMGPTRNYQSSGIANPAIWVMPVMPLGLYATFEEFISYNVPKQAVNDWYRGMVDFSVANRTNRLIYMHPPGAADWSDVVLGLLNYAKLNQNAGRFAWYTIADMARFMTTRNQVSWTETTASSGAHHYHATHPQTLSTMTWLFPKRGFARPVITGGSGVVTDGGDQWLVKAGKVKVLNFTAMPV